MTEVHVIPVDPSLTPEEAWREICIFGRRLTFTGTETWADIDCDGEECSNVERPETAPMSDPVPKARDDGTCWTCAKPRCLGAFGHMLGRLSYAVNVTRRRNPQPSLAVQMRLLWHDFIRHGLLGRGTEICQDCGYDYPLWHAQNDDWQRVMNTPGGLLCPTCFIRRGGVEARRG